MKRSTALAVAAACCSLFLDAAQATKIESKFFQVAGPSWTVELTVTNDGVVPSIGEFTVYFDQELYANLSILTSPLAWDTIAIQPDADIPAAGFADSMALAPANFLAATQSQGGFKVGFTLLAGAAAGALQFDIVDQQFQTIESGTTVFSLASPVPEPGSLPLLFCGLLPVGLLAARLRRRA